MPGPDGPDEPWTKLGIVGFVFWAVFWVLRENDGCVFAASRSGSYRRSLRRWKGGRRRVRARGIEPHDPQPNDTRTRPVPNYA